MIITGSTPSTSLKYYYTDDSDEGIVWVTPTDIINNITLESEKRLTSLGQKIAHIVPKNTILVTCIASIGKNTMLIDRGSFNQQINGLIPYENKYEPYFLLTESFIWSNKMKSSAPAGTMQIVNRKEFSEIDACIPNKSEQNSVGSFFRTLDHLITLHHSKSFGHILEAMVSCTLSWEQRKLGEYLIQYTEVTIINDQYPVLTSSRKGIFFQKDYYDGNQIASENNIGYNIVPYGYFTYRHMSDDEIFYFNINNIIDNGIVSTLYPVFTTNNRLDSKFLQYELNFGREFRKYSVLQKQGGSRTYMYFNKLRDLKLTITTSLKEQECIRDLICSIDHLITLHQLEPFQLIFKAIAHRIIDYAKSKPPRHTKYEIIISFIKYYV